jgi:SAM-dependent methyltransferase
MRQADIFLESEGNAWFERNRDRLGQFDSVSLIIDDMGLQPSNVLEVGCANGWRLAKLRDKYGCTVFGMDPSRDACREAVARQVAVGQSTADSIPARDGWFDLIIYGFCLYLTDPSDWLKIAAEGDRVLKDGGHIIIHDFETFASHARWYEHREGVLSYHVDWSNLWLGHPGYHVARRTFSTQHDTVIVLRKALSLEVRP